MIFILILPPLPQDVEVSLVVSIWCNVLISILFPASGPHSSCVPAQSLAIGIPGTSERRSLRASTSCIKGDCTRIYYY